MHPVRPSLAGAARIIDGLRNPAVAKFDGGQAHRMVLTLVKERGMVSIMGPNGRFYANAVGAFGVVSDGGNWGRLARAFHRWALKLVDKKYFPTLLFSDGALVLAESAISDES